LASDSTHALKNIGNWDAAIDEFAESTQCRQQIYLLMRSFEFTEDRDDSPTVGSSCRCLNLSTSIGGTHNKVEGGDRHDLEPEGLREDTRHKIYTGSGSQSSYPTSCLEYIAPCAWVLFPGGIGCSARYPALLYIVQGAGS
jgi:hypothetical protein